MALGLYVNMIRSLDFDLRETLVCVVHIHKSMFCVLDIELFERIKRTNTFRLTKKKNKMKNTSGLKRNLGNFAHRDLVTSHVNTMK